MNSTLEKNLPWAALFARLSLGLLLFVAGLGKFIGGLSNATGYIASGFQETWLPMFMVTPMAHLIPFAEVAVGALLILGIFRRPVLILAALLLLALSFGMMVQQEWSTVANNLQYVFFTAAALLLSPWDRFSVDGLRGNVGP